MVATVRTVRRRTAGRRAELGFDVAVSGDNIVVGAHWDDDRGTKSGSAYFYRYNEGTETWDLVCKRTAGDGTAEDYFGVCVAIDGDRAMIGAYKDDSPLADAGSAYVFHCSHTTGLWEQISKVTAPDEAAADYFGRRVAIDQDFAIAGIYAADDKGTDSGSARVYVSITGGALEQTWELDGVGNWTSTTANGVTQTREHDGRNRITSLDDDGTYVDYDSAGNMTVMPRIPLPGYSPGKLESGDTILFAFLFFLFPWVPSGLGQGRGGQKGFERRDERLVAHGAPGRFATTRRGPEIAVLGGL
jgi:hypothetical protein